MSVRKYFIVREPNGEFQAYWKWGHQDTVVSDIDEDALRFSRKILSSNSNYDVVLDYLNSAKKSFEFQVVYFV